MTALQAAGLSKVYGTGDTAVTALHNVDVAFAAGRFHAVMGASGSGKSTLMHCLAGLDRPTTGAVRIGGTDLTTLNDEKLTLLRRDHVGFVFQKFNLLPVLSAEENILLPLTIAGRRPDRAWFDRVVASDLPDPPGGRDPVVAGMIGSDLPVANAGSASAGSEAAVLDTKLWLFDPARRSYSVAALLFRAGPAESSHVAAAGRTIVVLDRVWSDKGRTTILTRFRTPGAQRATVSIGAGAQSATGLWADDQNVYWSDLHVSPPIHTGPGQAGAGIHVRRAETGQRLPVLLACVLSAGVQPSDGPTELCHCSRGGVGIGAEQDAFQRRPALQIGGDHDTRVLVGSDQPRGDPGVRGHPQRSLLTSQVGRAAVTIPVYPAGLDHHSPANAA